MSPIRFTATAIAAALLLAPVAFAQAGGYTPPRAADGKPDLQGFWVNTSLTSLERSGQFKELAIPPEQAAKLEAGRAAADARSALPTDPNSGAPTKGQDVGGYNSFYVDAGTHYATIKGEKRSSWIVDPPNGKIPYTPAGRKAFDDGLHFVRNTFDGPETRPMAERCLVGFGSTGGPPMINVMYNNTYQFVQTSDYVLINVEMNHDARIIPLGDANMEVYQWLGRSKGRWEGDTLVVETTNFNPGREPAHLLLGQLPAVVRRARDRAVHARQRHGNPLRLHGRRSEAVHAAVEGRDGVQPFAEAGLRIRLPRGQPCAAGHPGGRARQRYAGPHELRGRERVTSQAICSALSTAIWSK